MSNPDGTQNEVNRFGRKYKPGLLAGGAVLLARALNIVAARLSPRQWHHLRLRRPTKQERQRALVRECVRQEVAAEFDRQKAAEAAIWADCFADGVAAEPKRQRDRVMRLASSRAALSILNGKSNI